MNFKVYKLNPQNAHQTGCELIAAFANGNEAKDYMEKRAADFPHPFHFIVVGSNLGQCEVTHSMRGTRKDDK